MAGPIAYYEVQWRASDSDEEWSAMRVETSAKTATIKGVDRSKAYDIRARSVGPSGLTSAWVDISHTVAGNLPPDDPTDLIVRNVIDGVKLSWTYPRVQPTGTVACIEKSDLPGGDYEEVAQIRGDSIIISEFTDATFYYRVRNMNYLEQYSNYTASVAGRAILADLPAKELTIVAGAVEVDCYYDQFTLEVTENITDWNFINVGNRDTILIEVKQKGAFTVTFPSYCSPVSGQIYEITPVVNAVDVVGLTTANSGLTWRYTYQQPVLDGSGSGALSVLLTPNPAAASVYTDGVDSVAPSVEILATPNNGVNPITFAWSRTDSFGGADFLISDATSNSPTFSVAAGTTAYPTTTQVWRCVATDANGLQGEETVEITLSRTADSWEDQHVIVTSYKYYGSAVATATMTFKTDGTWELRGTPSSDPLKASGEWAAPGVVATDYECKFTKTGSGNVTNEAAVYTALTQDISIDVSAGPTYSEETAVGSVLAEIRRIDTPGVVTSGTFTYDLYAARDIIENCVCIDSYLPDGRQAKEVEVGNLMFMADPVTLAPFTGLVEYSRIAQRPCYRIVTDKFASLVCSDSAPIPVRRGGYRNPTQLVGHEVAVNRNGASGWEIVADVQYVGVRPVQHITVGDANFWAGEQIGVYMLHHNKRMS